MSDSSRDKVIGFIFVWGALTGFAFGLWQHSIAAGVFMAFVVIAAIGESTSHKKR